MPALLPEVRRVETCALAVERLRGHGLSVAAFAVANGRELYEVPCEALPDVGATLLLVAAWGPQDAAPAPAPVESLRNAAP